MKRFRAPKYTTAVRKCEDRQPNCEEPPKTDNKLYGENVYESDTEHDNDMR